MKTFLISPVRGYAPVEWQWQVSALEADGYEVHWPHRDTDQNDDAGLRICTDNLAAIRAADVVHVIWDGVSQGCLFDLGMAFALGKQVIPLSLPDATDGKSFQNMIHRWSLLDASPALTASEAEATSLRRALEEARKALEPFARADRAIGDEPGPFRFETERGYRLVEREHLRAAARVLSEREGQE